MKFAAIAEAQTCLGDKVPEIVTDALALAPDQSVIAAVRLKKLDEKRKKSSDHVSRLESVKEELLDKVFFQMIKSESRGPMKSLRVLELLL